MNSYFRAGRLAFIVAVGLASVAPVSAMAQAQTDDAAALARYKKAEAIAKAHIKTFDTLDFDVFSNQKWDRLKESRGEPGQLPGGAYHHPTGGRVGGLLVISRPGYACQNVTVTNSWCRTGHLEVVEAWAGSA